MKEHDTQLDTNPSQFEGDTEIWKTGISPGTKTQQIHSLAQSIVFRTTPLPLKSNQPTPNAYQMIAPVSVKQHDTQLDTNPSQFEGDTELWKTGISPYTKTQQIQSRTKHSL